MTRNEPSSVIARTTRSAPREASGFALLVDSDICAETTPWHPCSRGSQVKHLASHPLLGDGDYAALRPSNHRGLHAVERRGTCPTLTFPAPVSTSHPELSPTTT